MPASALNKRHLKDPKWSPLYFRAKYLIRRLRLAGYDPYNRPKGRLSKLATELYDSLQVVTEKKDKLVKKYAPTKQELVAEKERRKKRMLEYTKKYQKRNRKYHNLTTRIGQVRFDISAETSKSRIKKLEAKLEKLILEREECRISKVEGKVYKTELSKKVKKLKKGATGTRTITLIS